MRGEQLHCASFTLYSIIIVVIIAINVFPSFSVPLTCLYLKPWVFLLLLFWFFLPRKLFWVFLLIHPAGRGASGYVGLSCHVGLNHERYFCNILYISKYYDKEDKYWLICFRGGRTQRQQMCVMQLCESDATRWGQILQPQAYSLDRKWALSVQTQSKSPAKYKNICLFFL